MIRHAALGVLVGLLFTAPASARTIAAGVITVGHGANGVELDTLQAAGRQPHLHQKVA